MEGWLIIKLLKRGMHEDVGASCQMNLSCDKSSVRVPVLQINSLLIYALERGNIMIHFNFLLFYDLREIHIKQETIKNVTCDERETFHR